MNELARALRLGLGVAGLSMLVACGGGGGGGSIFVPDEPPPPVDSAPDDPQPEIDDHLTLTNTIEAHDLGFTGAGVTIGLLDSGIRSDHPTLQGRVKSPQFIYVDDVTNDLDKEDVVGHGTTVAQLAGGAEFGLWPGGIAPGVEFVSLRIIGDTPPEDDGSGQGNEVTDGSFLKEMHKDLSDSGAVISNNSWGGLYWEGDAVTKTFVDAMTPFVIDWGGLVVFATGNEGNANPSDTASLPSQSAYAEVLEQGWLAVAALDTLNPTALAEYSNACGIAMNYCLVAPGDVVFTGLDDTPGNPTYWVGGGTSFAAPQVSGAAALVWEAFPYFDNDMVRQTLLGTATDLGAEGVDSIFGYGLLNVGKAVKGPSRFDWGDADVTLDIDSTWSNDIAGEGGLIKRGTGTLTLTGGLGYGGTTQVIDGELIASDLPGHLYIKNNASASGVRSVGGDLRNDAVFTVSGGDVSVTGDYVNAPFDEFPSSATLQLELGSVLRVQGEALLGGELIVIGKQDGYVASAHTEVVTAEGGLTGTFASVGSAANVMLEATPGYDANSAWLDVTRVEVTAIDGMDYSASTYSAAQRVEGAFDNIDNQIYRGTLGGSGLGTDFVKGAGSLQQAGSMKAVERSLASLSGELHGADTAFAMMAIEGSRHALESRLDDLGNGSLAGAWADRLDGQRSMWSNTRLDANGWMLGQDYRFGPQLTVGAAFGQTDGIAAHDLRGDRERNRQLEAQGYAAWSNGGNYLMGRVAMGRMDRWMQRDILLGSERFGVDAQYDNRYATVGLQAGHRFKISDATLTPYVGTQSLQLDRDGFSEQGAAGFGLSTHESRLDATQALAGARLERQWSVGATRISLQGRMEWQRTLSQSGDAIDARFAGLDAWSPITGAGLGEEAAVFGFGVHAWLPVGGKLGFELDSRRENGRSYTGAFANWSIGF
ncbi:S8 family serine peptidase [Lysobacter sp. F6437]|uniref:S8 family serine peptidase n=1 Tax=Lysobacter sp. F6437 TaxID=3459296 RepID=UPI00403DDEDF